MSDARQPSFFIGDEIVYPGVLFSTTTFEIVVARACRGWFVHVRPRVRDEELGAVDDPRAVAQLRGRAGRARVGACIRLREAEAAEAAGRTRGREPTRFCSSVPYRRIGIVPSEVCAATVIATDESMRVSSSIAIA